MTVELRKITAETGGILAPVYLAGTLLCAS